MLTTAESDQDPHGVGAPAEKPVDAEDGADEQDVENRVDEGDERGEHPDRLVLCHGLDHDGEPGGQHQEGHRNPVHPTMKLELRDADPDQMEHPDRDQRVPGQPEDVCERRIRSVRLAGVDHAPGGASDEPEQQRHPERQPGPSGDRLEGGTTENECRTEGEDRIVDPVVVEPVRSSDPEEIVGRLQDREHPEHQPQIAELHGHREELTLLVDAAGVLPAPARGPQSGWWAPLCEGLPSVPSLRRSNQSHRSMTPTIFAEWAARRGNQRHGSPLGSKRPHRMRRVHLESGRPATYDAAAPTRRWRATAARPSESQGRPGRICREPPVGPSSA